MKNIELHSMTGYGRGAAAQASLVVTVEMRSVNGRFLEIRPKLPRGAQYLEPGLRESIQAKVSRGVLDVMVSIGSSEGNRAARVEVQQALYYADCLAELQKQRPQISSAEWAQLLQLPRAVSGDDSAPEFDQAIVSRLFADALAQALSAFQNSRAEEARRLSQAILREQKTAATLLAAIKAEKNQTGAKLQQLLQKRLQDMLADAKLRVDETRLVQEVAFHLDRSDITEEIDRLTSHLAQLQAVASGEKEQVVGKRLDLLTQEALRETNTIAAKCASLDIANNMLELKLSLERIREQAQNIE